MSVSELRHIHCTFCLEWPFLKTWSVSFMKLLLEHEWVEETCIILSTFCYVHNRIAHLASAIYQLHQGMRVSLNMLLVHKTLQISSQEYVCVAGPVMFVCFVGSVLILLENSDHTREF
jgi:hypothetical protein